MSLRCDARMLWLCCLWVGLTACSDEPVPASLSERLSAEQKHAFNTLSKSLFVEQALPVDIEGFAYKLESLLAHKEDKKGNNSDVLGFMPEGDTSHSPTLIAVPSYSLDITDHLDQTFEHEAKRDLTMKRLQQFFVHHVASLGELQLTPSEQQMLANIVNWQKFAASLQALVSQHEVFTLGSMTIYDINNEQQTFAYRREYKNTRAYIAFNFSYDVQVLPVPLGFMSSTKITLWQSDTTTIETFVTNGEIMMRPLSANIIIND